MKIDVIIKQVFPKICRHVVLSYRLLKEKVSSSQLYANSTEPLRNEENVKTTIATPRDPEKLLVVFLSMEV